MASCVTKPRDCVLTLEYESGSCVRNNGRAKWVFDNGAESDMLHRSLYKVLLKDEFGISERIEQGAAMTAISDQDAGEY